MGFDFGPNSGFGSVGINLSANTNASGVTLCFFIMTEKKINLFF